MREARLPWGGAGDLRYYCFDADAARLVPLQITTADATDTATWQAAWERAIAASACADEYAR